MYVIYIQILLITIISLFLLDLQYPEITQLLYFRSYYYFSIDQSTLTHAQTTTDWDSESEVSTVCNPTIYSIFE